MLFVNLHLARLLRLLTPHQRTYVVRDHSFMGGGAALSVLCGLQWLPQDLDLYSSDFKLWGFSFNQEIDTEYGYTSISAKDLPRYIECAMFYSSYLEVLNLKVIEARHDDWAGKCRLGIDFIETKLEAQDVIAQYDFPFLQNAFLFKNGKVNKVIINNLKSLLCRQGDLNANSILSLLQVDKGSLDEWKQSGGIEELKHYGSPYLADFLMKDYWVWEALLPLRFGNRLNVLKIRINKYEKRGFQVTPSSRNAFLSAAENILGLTPEDPRAQKRQKRG